MEEATQTPVKENNLTAYRRHLKSCKHLHKGQSYQACSCPIWAYGTLNGKPCRKSLDLRDWARAEKKIKKWENGAEEVKNDPNDNRTLKSAIDACITDLRRLKKAEGTVKQYEIVLGQLLAFSTEGGITTLRTLDHQAIEDYTKSRAVKPSTLAKEWKIIKAFLGWCARVPRRWVTENAAQGIELPANDSEPTLPFTRDEQMRLIRAADRYTAGWHNGSPEERRRSELRARAIILLFLYSGMRLGDVAQFSRDRFDARTGKILLRVEKTKVPVYLTLQPEARGALMALPVESDSEYFFYAGTGTRAALVGNVRRIFDRLALRAGVLNAHPHRCRDTFAVELLLAGTDIRVVQYLLGHKSIRTTEKAYAPYVKAFQDQLDAATAKLPSAGAGMLPFVSGEEATGNAQSNVLPFAATR